jgi:hypothetical protein
MRFLFLLFFLPLMACAQGPVAFIPFMMGELETDWASRVVANGGAMPSANTIQAMETLRTGCIAASLTNKIYSLCVAIDGNIIATSTPLFKHFGSDPWTNNGFVNADVNINGCKGDGTSKSFDTGVKPKLVQIPANGSSIGLTMIVTESASNESRTPIGYQDSIGNPLIALEASYGGITRWFATESTGATSIATNDFGQVGYISGNRTTNAGTTNLSLYVASPTESHKLLASLSGSIPAVATTTENTLSVFALKNGATNTAWSTQRLSLVMVHDGFTQTESSNFWVLAKACRESLGGGTGDPVHDWNRKVVAAGGANVSSTTSNALRIFRSGLDTDGTLYKMAMVNPVPPDSLTAVRVPFIWQAGSEIWGNINFATSNLTVNGLIGDGTSKYFNTGIRPNTTGFSGMSTTSGGISGMISSNSAAGGRAVMLLGSIGTSAQHFMVYTDSSTTQFRCWDDTTSGTQFVNGTLPGGSNWCGWISGNRIASNDIKIYCASSTNAHASIVTGAGANASVIFSGVDMFAWALNNNGSVSATTYCDHRLSFLAMHGGLTETQSSNLFVRASTLRTALGGGSP